MYIDKKTIEVEQKYLDREDRIILVKKRKYLSNELEERVFMVYAQEYRQYNIVSLLYGNRYFNEYFESLVELSEALTKEFEDFKVLPLKIASNLDYYDDWE